MVYGNAITPSLNSKWGGNVEGNCKLCVENCGTIQHILSACPELSHWRHDKVLKQIYDQVLYDVEHRVNNPRR